MELHLLDEVPGNPQDSDDEVEHVLHAEWDRQIEECIAPLSFSDESSEENVFDLVDLKEKPTSFRTWFPTRLSPCVSHWATQRKIYRPSNATY